MKRVKKSAFANSDPRKEERNITSLNQTLPKLRNWENFLNNDSKKND